MPDALREIFLEAFQHRGFSFVVVTTPCVTFDHVNITYERMRENWHTVPDTHDASDYAAAMHLAMDTRKYSGVIYRETRPTWEDLQREVAGRAQE